MKDKSEHTESALQVWASTVMSGAGAEESETVGAVGRAPGHAHYDPADVITVFMTARESAKARALAGVTGDTGDTGGERAAVDVEPAEALDA
jgi:hypothetical protein